METNLQVLICDDSLLVRKKLREFLEEKHCTVYEAKNGQEGAEIFRTIKPDIVFMDIVMPVVDGLECLKRIIETDSDAKVVMLSSIGTANNLKEALKAGAVDFIQKPYDKDQISRVLSNLKR